MEDISQDVLNKLTQCMKLFNAGFKIRDVGVQGLFLLTPIVRPPEGQTSPVRDDRHNSHGF
jgi:hypothetical protein